MMELSNITPSLIFLGIGEPTKSIFTLILKIIELLSLEKTSKITKTNHQSITTMPMFLIATSTCFSNIYRDGDSTTSLGSLLHHLIILPEEKMFPNIEQEPPLTQLEAIIYHL